VGAAFGGDVDQEQRAEEFGHPQLDGIFLD
jgi:hypothetical protein